MKSYTCPPEGFKFLAEMKKDFDEDGYVMIRGLFSKDEVEHIETALTSGPFTGYTYGVEDDSGHEIEMVKWSNPGNDVTGMVSRCEKVAGTCEKLLDGDVYHYHTKVMMKRANSGKHLWHQDYGYWYTYGFLRPQMLTVFIAIDKCMPENGCLQILKGSHKVGRIDHSLTAGQLGVSDIDRVNELQKTCPLEYVELEPGDAVFFHCNLLHCSNVNTSNLRRWAFLSAYNRADNRMLDEQTAKHKMGHGNTLLKVPDSAVLACEEFNNVDGKKFELITDRPFPVRAIGTEQK